MTIWEDVLCGVYSEYHQLFFCGLLQIIDNFLYLIRQKGERREKWKSSNSWAEEEDEKIKFTACLSLFLESNNNQLRVDTKMHKERPLKGNVA